MRPLTALLASSLALSLACSDAGPDTRANYLTITLDGVDWPSDTVTAIVRASLCDTNSSLAALRELPEGRAEIIALLFPGFPAVGHHVLGDTSTRSFAFYARGFDGPGIWSQWFTRQGSLGTLTISAVDLADSTMTGSFAFEAATIPDTAPRHHVAGQFKTRFTLQPVFIVACPAAPRRPDPTGRIESRQ